MPRPGTGTVRSLRRNATRPSRKFLRSYEAMVQKAALLGAGGDLDCQALEAEGEELGRTVAVSLDDVLSRLELVAVSRAVPRPNTDSAPLDKEHGSDPNPTDSDQTCEWHSDGEGTCESPASAHTNYDDATPSTPADCPPLQAELQDEPVPIPLPRSLPANVGQPRLSSLSRKPSAHGKAKETDLPPRNSSLGRRRSRKDSGIASSTAQSPPGTPVDGAISVILVPPSPVISVAAPDEPYEWSAPVEIARMSRKSSARSRGENSSISSKRSMGSRRSRGSVRARSLRIVTMPTAAPTLEVIEEENTASDDARGTWQSPIGSAEELQVASAPLVLVVPPRTVSTGLVRRPAVVVHRTTPSGSSIGLQAGSIPQLPEGTLWYDIPSPVPDREKFSFDDPRERKVAKEVTWPNSGKEQRSLFAFKVNIKRRLF
ncbi:hypothetical protein DFJ74DRAFT_679448 [Hyaloraphidium curvatum]|nr:hypothetical protein DFJ74DRAFT_679448 [Hyaloraphidium curvatum]